MVSTEGDSIVVGITWMLLGAAIERVEEEDLVGFESEISSTKQVPSTNKVSFLRTTVPSTFVRLDIVIDRMDFPEVCISKSN